MSSLIILQNIPPSEKQNKKRHYKDQYKSTIKITGINYPIWKMWGGRPRVVESRYAWENWALWNINKREQDEGIQPPASIFNSQYSRIFNAKIVPFLQSENAFMATLQFSPYSLMSEDFDDTSYSKTSKSILLSWWYQYLYLGARGRF